MPGIQLIPMADNSGAPADAMGDLGNMLFRAQQSKVQQQQAAAEMLLKQREADEKSQQHQALMQEHQRQLQASAIEEIMQHKDNPAMMRMVAQKYGMPLEDITSQQSAPTPMASPQQSAPVAQGAPDGQSPISMQQLMGMDASPPPDPRGDSFAGMDYGGFASPQGGSNNTVKVKDPIVINAGNGTPGPTPDQEHLDYAHQLLTHDNAVSQQADKVDQFQAADQAAKNGTIAQAPSPVYRFGAPGHEVTIDTGALKAGEESNKADRIKQFKIALADNPDAQKLATMMVHLGQPDDAIAKALVETGKIDARFAGRMDLLEKTMANRSDMLDRTLGNRTDIESQREAARLALQKEHETAAGNSAAPGGFNTKIEAANRMALKGLNTQTNTVALRNGLPQMGKAVAGLDETEALIKSGNPTAAAAGLERFVGVSRSGTGNGAAATNAALALFQKHMGGAADNIDGFIEKLKSGNLGAEQRVNLLGAVQTARDSIKQSANPFHQSFVDTWYNEGNANIKGNVEDQEETIFGPLGYHPQRDPSAKRIRPMSGQLPSAAAAGSGGSPREGAANLSSVSAAEQDLYKRALDAVKDPGSSPSRKANAQRFISDIESRLQRM